MKRILLVAVAISILSAGMVLAASGQWLHIRAASEGEEQFSINLPISLVDTLLPMVDDQDWDRGRLRSHGLRWEDKDWTVAELRELWNSVKAERGYDLARFSDHGSNARLFLDDRYLRVESDDNSRDHVSAKIPIPIIDALLSGEGERLNLIAALDTLKGLGTEELIMVDSDEGSVQVWIDDGN